MSKYQGPERRSSQNDRRSKTRSGKFDRRKNRCDQCQFYKAQTALSGTCQKHQTMIRADDFACTFFAHLGGLKPSGSRPESSADDSADTP
ncbi:MAG: hypothetical protein KC474_00120 [Cyanobacteria bacterium HKST-UBA04]|nr:hypothetical protein [Cyanobacteria bacterium HKST-UBA04]